jgi:hypothetical protein
VRTSRPLVTCKIYIAGGSIDPGFIEVPGFSSQIIASGTRIGAADSKGKVLSSPGNAAYRTYVVIILVRDRHNNQAIIAHAR